MDEAAQEATSAYEELFRELYRPVLGFFARRGCSPEECRDLAQETFLRVHRSFGRFRGKAKASTWVFTIAANLWRNRRREAAAAKRSGEEVPLSEGAASSAPEDRPQEQALDAERRRLLREAIADLPPQMRLCVWHRVYQDRSYDEIVQLLGVTATTAKSQVSRATSRLRSSLAEHYPELATTDPDDRKG